MQRGLISWGARALRRFYCNKRFPSEVSVSGTGNSELGKLPDRRLYLSFKVSCFEESTSVSTQRIRMVS